MLSEQSIPILVTPAPVKVTIIFLMGTEDIHRYIFIEITIGGTGIVRGHCLAAIAIQMNIPAMCILAARPPLQKRISGLAIPETIIVHGSCINHIPVSMALRWQRMDIPGRRNMTGTIREETMALPAAPARHSCLLFFLQM